MQHTVSSKIESKPGLICSWVCNASFICACGHLIGLMGPCYTGELRVDGLVIELAVYGCLVLSPSASTLNDDQALVVRTNQISLSSSFHRQDSLHALQIDVTVPVQCLVQDSQLHLPATSKVRTQARICLACCSCVNILSRRFRPVCLASMTHALARTRYICMHYVHRICVFL